ncbi:MAG: carboxymuconolactone decarboxylase family protein [Micropepsaceae bacterium]
MNRWLLTKLLMWSEKQLGGVNMDYAYHLRDVMPSQLWRFSMIKTVEGPRKFTPPGVYHAAGLAAAMVEDCGPCVQIHVNLALKDGVSAETLRALVSRQLAGVPADIALGFRYGDAIARGIMADDLRDNIRRQWGEKGLIELAFTIATARFYPAVKRGMGYADTCERVLINDQVTPAGKAA